MEYKCKICGTTLQEDTLPYQWASIRQKSAGVHDSARKEFEDDYFLCPECRPEAMAQRLNG